MKKTKKKNKPAKPKQLPFKEQLHSANLTIERILVEMHRAAGEDKVYTSLLSTIEQDLDILEMELEEEQEFIEGGWAKSYPAADKESRAHIANLKRAKTAYLKSIKLLEKFIKQKKTADKLWLGK